MKYEQNINNIIYFAGNLREYNFKLIEETIVTKKRKIIVHLTKFFNKLCTT